MITELDIALARGATEEGFVAHMGMLQKLGDRLDYLFRSSNCPSCGGCCRSCAECEGYFSDIPHRYVQLLKHKYGFNRITGFYRNTDGCALPRYFRSETCNRWMCSIESNSKSGLTNSEIYTTVFQLEQLWNKLIGKWRSIITMDTLV